MSTAVQPVHFALEAITNFMQRTGIPIEDLGYNLDGALERRVREIVQTWEPVTDIAPERLEASLVTGIDIAGLAYAHTRLDTQVHIALFTFLATCFDDHLASASAEFTARFHAGLPQRHPLLQHFSEILHAMDEYFLPFAARAIVNNALTYMERNVFDRESRDMPLHGAALQYVEWKRMNNGMAEAYAFFVWERYSFSDVYAYVQALPEMLLCVNYMNDIFSFYKEELDGDTTNYTNERALVTNKTVPAALLDVVNDTVAAVHNARNILLQADGERAAMESFVAGYAIFHIYSPRYRLLDLLKGSEIIPRKSRM